jgi:hypothetical protein
LGGSEGRGYQISAIRDQEAGGGGDRDLLILANVRKEERIRKRRGVEKGSPGPTRICGVWGTRASREKPQSCHQKTAGNRRFSLRHNREENPKSTDRSACATIGT